MLLDHACRLCGGRLLRTGQGVMCTCCEVAGAEPADICYCGLDGCRCIVFEGHAPGVSPRIVPDWTKNR